MALRRVLFMVLVGIFVLTSVVYADILMTPDNVEKIMGKPDWVILDCRPKKKYEEGHIPGAITLGDSCRVKLRDGTQRVLPPAKLEKILGEAGISNEKHVVVYSDADIVHATVGYWILEYLGHEGKVHLLDGGIVEWKALGKPLSKEETKLPPATFKAKVNERIKATTEEILKIAKGEVKDVQLIDARTEKEYTGYDVRALRGGHIPNTTINVSHELNFDKQTGKILPLKILKERFFGRLDPNKRTIALCQTGSRSTLTYIVLKLLGFKDVANYDDSWVVYGNSVYPPFPIEDEQWMNIEALNKDLPKLEKEVKALQDEIKSLKEALEKAGIIKKEEKKEQH